MGDENDPTSAVVVSFNAAKNAWVASSGEPVCQDHAHVQPCPYEHGRRR